MNGVATCLCQCTESSLVRRGVRYDDRVEVRRCQRCGLVFLWPRPTVEDLYSYYEKIYRVDYETESIKERYLGDISEARARVARLLPILADSKRLLEIGCGSGAFLEAVRPYLLEVTGVEPDSESRKWINETFRFQVLARLQDIPRSSARFDIVALFHVLEHFPDPVGFLRELRELINPNGCLIVEVPDISDALVSLYQVPAYLDFYFQKAHLFYFSRDTLASALREGGFQAKIECLQRYDLSNHLVWMLHGRPGGLGYYRNVFSHTLDCAYAESLINSGHADTLWAVAQPSG